MSPATFAAARSGPSAQASGPGSLITYILNAATTVRFTVLQALHGRMQGKGSNAHCAPVSKHNHNAPRCTRTVTLNGSFTQAGRAGANSFHFTGRLNAHKLKPGNYTLVATPVAGAKAGRSVSTSFQIIA
jgi:hypothetical protein